MTITAGGATLGNWVIGRLVIDNPPRNKMMIEMTIANAGLWRNLENMVLGESGGCPGAIEHAQLFRMIFQVCKGLLRLTILVYSTFSPSRICRMPSSTICVSASTPPSLLMTNRSSNSFSMVISV